MGESEEDCSAVNGMSQKRRKSKKAKDCLPQVYHMQEQLEKAHMALTVPGFLHPSRVKSDPKFCEKASLVGRKAPSDCGGAAHALADKH
jgi:hypothetical protein